MKKNILLSAALMCGSLGLTAQEYFRIDGYAIPVEEIDSMVYEDVRDNEELLPCVLSRDTNISIFYEALELTHLADSLRDEVYYDYSVGKDSIDWTNDALVIPVATEYDNVAYMKRRYKKYTVFAEPDSIYKAAGINNLKDLKAYAAKIYDEVYPEDAGVTDPTDRRNSLNRFVAYHILDRLGEYYTLTAVDGPNSTLAKNWDRTKWDIADWYETMMPHSIMKLSFPAGTTAGGLYINRRGVMSRPDERGVQVRGSMVYHPAMMATPQYAYNGIYHYIDRIIHYGKETQEVVLDERMRIDASTLSPDFMTSGARGHRTRSSYEGGKYGQWDATMNKNNRNTCLGFKAGAAKNFEFTDAVHMHVRPRVLSFWSYQGDEVTIKGKSSYDLTVKLPPVPAGTYEVRLGTCTGFASRGKVQFFIDGEMCADSVDLRFDGRTLDADYVERYGDELDIDEDDIIGWKSDNTILTMDDHRRAFDFDAYVERNGIDISGVTEDELWAMEDSLFGVHMAAYDACLEAAIAAHDKELRSRGWMKGPDSYANAISEAGGTRSSTSFRGLSVTLRRIVGTFYTDGKSDHYLRIKHIPGTSISSWGTYQDSEINFDYLELCPKSVYDNPAVPEDRW